MEEKISIAKILKYKPEKTILYDAMRDINVSLYVVEKQNGETNIFCDGMEKFKECSFVYSDTGADYIFRKGMQLLKPSKEMQDWEKFSWKKGDVLQNNDHNIQVIFGGFTSDTYEMIRCKYWLKVDNGNEKFVIETNEFTKNFFKISEELSQCYINEIENRLGGKLNLETLKIEKTQPEFKDGDIAFADYGNRQDVFIVSDKTDLSEGYSSFISLDLNSLTLSMGCRTTFFKKDLCKLRLATEEEKRQLFSALEKEGKAWDAEKKQIVDLKPKCELKPFDRCIWKIRNCEGSIWRASFVSYVDEYGATPMDVSIDEDLVNLIILPYNDQTKLLVGTTDEWEGGEQ